MGVVAALLATTAGPASGATRHVVPRPDLVVASGAVKVAPATGRATGRFVVANRGTARAGRSTAALSVLAARRWRRVRRFALPRLRAGRSTTIAVSATLARSLRTGALAIRVCADSGQAVREGSEADNCRTLGRTPPAPGATPGGIAAPAPATAPAPAGPAAPAPLARPASSVPADPIAFTKDTIFKLGDAEGGYWITVPQSYDATHATPTALFVWLHGCGGFDEEDIATVSPGGAGQRYLSVSPDGREGGCWDPGADTAKVLAAVADVKTHFNVDPRRVVVGGYSSGGDLAYRTAFFNASTFAGVLAENTSPFRDTGATQQASLAAVTWPFHVVHLAHAEDDAYPIDGVRSETDALAAAGFPVTRIERPGHHYDPDTTTTGTDHDLVTLLLPHLDDGWLAPP